MAKKKSKSEKKVKIESSEPVPMSEDQAEDANIDSDVRPTKLKKLPNEVYERELEKLQIELVKMQYWIKETGLKVVVI